MGQSAEPLSFGTPESLPMTVGLAAHERPLRPANVEAQAARRRRLKVNANAMEWLSGACGLSAATVEHFGFGLDASYGSARTGQTAAHALTFPLLHRDGVQLATILKADVPGVTQSPKGAWWSSSKEEATFYANAGEPAEYAGVLVFDMPDAWRAWQEVQAGAALQMQVIASTAVDDTPREWSSPTSGPGG